MNNQTPRKDGKHIEHPLNLSRSKSAYSFKKSKRFILQKNYSPNKFYDHPSTLSHRKPSIGYGNKVNFQKPHFIEPTKYIIPSQFDKLINKKPKFTTFGINREQYYNGKQFKNSVGPGAYDISSTLQSGIRSIYFDNKTQRKQSKNNNLNPTGYKIKDENVNKRSIYQNTEKQFKNKADYYPKNPVQHNGNKNLRTRTYFNEQSHKQSKSSIFAKQERIKVDKPSKVGPGSYNRFSQFDIL